MFSLDDLVVFQMFHLECHDIKHGLITIAQEFTDQLVESLADMHKKENERQGVTEVLLNHVGVAPGHFVILALSMVSQLIDTKNQND